MQGESKFAGIRPAGLAGMLAAVGVLALTISIGTAAAHKVAFDSNLQLKVDDLSDTVTQFSGKVTSNKGKCEVNRPVTVFVNGVPVATATTFPGGFWSATGPKPLKGSTVIATIPKKILFRKKKRKGKKGHLHKCRPDSAQKKAN